MLKRIQSFWKIIHLEKKLNISLMYAVSAIGIRETAPTEKRLSFLSNLLDDDMPMEFGGGAAHGALATQGRAGLKILIERASSENNKNFKFAGSAICGIRDPYLLPDLDALARRTDMPERTRFNAIGAIGFMADKNYATERIFMVI